MHGILRETNAGIDVEMPKGMGAKDMVETKF